MTEPHLTVISQPCPEDPGASTFTVTGDTRAAVEHQVSAIMNDPLVQAATFPGRAFLDPEKPGEWKMQGRVTLWPDPSKFA